MDVCRSLIFFIARYCFSASIIIMILKKSQVLVLAVIGSLLSTAFGLPSTFFIERVFKVGQWH